MFFTYCFCKSWRPSLFVQLQKPDGLRRHIRYLKSFKLRYLLSTFQLVLFRFLPLPLPPLPFFTCFISPKCALFLSLFCNPLYLPVSFIFFFFNLGVQRFFFLHLRFLLFLLHFLYLLPSAHPLFPFLIYKSSTTYFCVLAPYGLCIFPMCDGFL